MRKKNFDHKRNTQEEKNYFQPIHMLTAYYVFKKLTRGFFRVGIHIVLDVNNTNNECKHRRDG